MQPIHAIAQPTPPALDTYAVPQRFGIAALLGMTTLFACLFAALRAMTAPPAVYLFFGSMGCVIGLAQMKIGAAPRIASAIAGAVLLPVWIVVAAIFSSAPSDIGAAVLGLPCSIVGGALLGYVTGAIMAGVFLFLDLATDKAKRKSAWSPNFRPAKKQGAPRVAASAAMGVAPNASAFGGFHEAVVTQRDLVCRLCQSVSRQTLLVARPPPPIADLDLRPAEPLRAALPYAIQCCPSCGYCAGDVSFAPTHAHECVSRPEYASLRTDASLPPLARQFLCAALLDDAGQESVRAVWQRLHAAWACDDADNQSSAARCRLLAAESMHRALSAHRTIAGGEAADYVLLADLYRRAGEHIRALAMLREAQSALERSPAVAAALARIVAFESARALAHDARSYTIAEARL